MKTIKKIVALCVLASTITSIYSNQEQDSSEDATRRICGSGVCCPVSQSCSSTLPVVSLAGSFNFTATPGEPPTVTSVAATQGACFTVTSAGDTIIVNFTRPFSVPPVVLAQRLSGSSSITLSNVTHFGFTIAIAAAADSPDTISFIAQQACL